LIVNVFHMYVLELAGIAFGLLTLLGLILLIARRIMNPKLFRETTIMDWVLLLVLLAQVVSGSYIAHFLRWGAVWYPYSPVPWLKSLVHLNPQVDFITPLPWIVRFHSVNAFVVIGLIPFTRLVHIFTVPVTYLWRPLQVVIWNRKTAR
ncbi:MAG TPA: respiratory nitrate reductase subunit gamma, partial [Dissulfurispiraceae bacterium]